MPAFDQVFYKANHHDPVKNPEKPTIITTRELNRMRNLAHPVLCKSNQESYIQTQLSNQETQQSLKSTNRANKWANSTFGNEEVRLARLQAHKDKLMQNTLDLSACYEKRLQLEKEELLKRQQQKLDDQNEYTRYLKSAKQAALVAQYEQEAKEEKAIKAAQKFQNDKNYRAFVEGAAAAEKEFAHQIMKRYRDNCKQCADFNKQQIENKELEKYAEKLEVLERGEDAKTMHQKYLDSVAKEKEEARKKRDQNREYFEESLRLEKEAKERRKLQIKGEILEEKLTNQTQQDMFDYAARRQKEAIQANVEATERLQELGRKAVEEAEEKRRARLQSMDLDAIDQVRKREQLAAWKKHWKEVEDDCRLTQQVQRAERKMNSTLAKMDSLAYGKTVIDLARAEQELKNQASAKAREIKAEMGRSRRQEVEEKRAATLKAMRDEDQEDYQRIKQANDRYKEEQKRCRDMALAEPNEAIRNAYMRVVKQMDKQETTVSWQREL